MIPFSPFGYNSLRGQKCVEKAVGVEGIDKASATVYIGLCAEAAVCAGAFLPPVWLRGCVFYWRGAREESLGMIGLGGDGRGDNRLRRRGGTVAKVC